MMGAHLPGRLAPHQRLPLSESEVLALAVGVVVHPHAQAPEGEDAARQLSGWAYRRLIIGMNAEVESRLILVGSWFGAKVRAGGDKWRVVVDCHSAN